MSSYCFFKVNKLSNYYIALLKESKVESFAVKYNMINVKYLKVLRAVYSIALTLLLFNALYLFFLCIISIFFPLIY